MKTATITAIIGSIASQTAARTIILGTHHQQFGGDSNVAWISGLDPCNVWTDLAQGDGSPCGKHFTIGGGVKDVHFEGCGGDLSVWQGGEKLGDCGWDPGHQGCFWGGSFDGKFTCPFPR
ncbi:hypothetical protein BKA66DRAFT_445196 [Pyrenochaeta sp. MPI-SDFR-AT-0127]|nr:hypothetical protein BKA66DRAFT_445196 [Pyrenochaeta sp. MPI-SDFR-AT-0127]